MRMAVSLEEWPRPWWWSVYARYPDNRDHRLTNVICRSQPPFQNFQAKWHKQPLRWVSANHQKQWLIVWPYIIFEPLIPLFWHQFIFTSFWSSAISEVLNIWPIKTSHKLYVIGISRLTPIINMYEDQLESRSWPHITPGWRSCLIMLQRSLCSWQRYSPSHRTHSFLALTSTIPVERKYTIGCERETSSQSVLQIMFLCRQPGE